MKANDTAIQGLTNKLGQLGDTATARSDKTFKFFKQSAKPALDYYSTLLGGDTGAITKLLSPEIGTINQNAKNAKMQLWNSPRGGGKVSAEAGIDAGTGKQISDLFNTARPMAAGALSNLAGMFGQQSLGQGGQAIGASQAGSQNLFGQNQQQLQIQAQTNAAWSALGSGIGALGGAALGAPTAGGGSILGDKCCFIFLECLNGTLPPHVRRYRDFYYNKYPTIAKGYKKMAKWLVPLMKRFGFIKSFINKVMVQPIIDYGFFLDQELPYSLSNHLIKLWWFGIWRLYGKFSKS